MSERDDMNLTPEELRMQKSVRDLPVVPASEDFRANLRAQFMSGEIAAALSPDVPVETAQVVELPAPSKRRRRRWAFIPAVAAALAIVFLNSGNPAWQLEEVRGIGAVTINGQILSAVEAETIAKLIVPEARIGVAEGVQLDIVLDGVMVVGLAGPAEFTLPANPQDKPYQYQATIYDGEFRVKTGPDFPGRELVLLTSEGRVEITGTSIAVFKNAEVTCVCVLEGTAMIGKDKDHLDAIVAGMRKVMFVDGSDPMIIPIEPGHKDNLIEFEGYNEDTFE